MQKAQCATVLDCCCLLTGFHQCGPRIPLYNEKNAKGAKNMRKACAWLLLFVIVLMPMIGMGEGENTAEAASEGVAMWINGEAVYQSQIDSVTASVTESMGQFGLDTSEEEIASAISDVAQRQVIEDRLLSQDMTAQGMYDLTQEDENTVAQAAKQTVEAAKQAQAAMEVAGYTEDFFKSYYRNVLASERYEAWLVRNDPEITQEEIEAAYRQRTDESKSLYAQDIPAFETALASGEEIWYRPAGYRAVLQIMLSAQGETDDEKLASVSEKTSDIYDRLEAGETFESLISEYGEDPSFDDPAFAETGYQVHPDSILWEEAFVQAAFAKELAKPGDVSQPHVFGNNVCILYYLKDVDGGAAELTENLREALYDDLYAQQVESRLQERLDTLEAEAEITFP